ncbi:MAG: hypothetical protein ACR2NB_08865 [Solirubrobacteraceae bacterium]
MRDPDERLQIALEGLYRYYDEAEPMLANLLRDLDLVEAARDQFAGFLEYRQAAQDVLMTGRRGRARQSRRARIVIGHATAFTTWRSLVREQGCSLDEAVQLMGRLARLQ